MRKPITVLREEFAENLAAIINQSDLPAFVISEILERTFNQVKALEVEQYNRDKAVWEKAQEKAPEEETE